MKSEGSAMEMTDRTVSSRRGPKFGLPTMDVGGFNLKSLESQLQKRKQQFHLQLLLEAADLILSMVALVLSQTGDIQTSCILVWALGGVVGVRILTMGLRSFFYHLDELDLVHFASTFFLLCAGFCTVHKALVVYGLPYALGMRIFINIYEPGRDIFDKYFLSKMLKKAAKENERRKAIINAPRDWPVVIRIEGSDRIQVESIAQEWVNEISATVLTAEMDTSDDGKHFVAAIFVDINDGDLVYAANRFRVKKWMNFGVKDINMLHPERSVDQQLSNISPGVEVEIIYTLLQTPLKEGGCDIHRLLAARFDGVSAIKMFPLHDRKMSNAFVEAAFSTVIMSDQLILDIALHFGDQIGLYFAFLAMYTKWLFGLSLCGLPVYFLRYYKDNWYFISCACFGIFTSLWATAFIENWERDMERLKLFGLGDYPAVEQPRFEYYGDDKLNPVTGTPEKVFDPKMRQIKNLKTAVILLLLFCVVIACAAVLFYIYFYLDDVNCYFYVMLGINGPDIGPYSRLVFQTVGTNVVWAIVLDVINFSVIYKIAIMTTQNENHRTQGDWEMSMSIKVCVFFMLDVFAWYFLLAFLYIPYTRGYYQWDIWKILFSRATIEGIEDAQFTEQEIIEHTCQWMWNLGAFIQFFLLVVQLWTLAVESLIPSILKNLCLRGQLHLDLLQQFTVEEIEVTGTDRMRLVQQDGDMGPYEIMFDLTDMCATQWGMVIIMGVACPLAPLLCLANNILEAKSDLAKICALSQRSWPKKCMGFTPWLQMMRALSFISVFLNVGIVCLCSPALEMIHGGCGDTLEDVVATDFQMLKTTGEPCLTLSEKLLFAFVCQMFLGCAKLVINIFSSELPYDVKIALMKKDHQEKMSRIQIWEKEGLLKAPKSRDVSDSKIHDEVRSPLKKPTNVAYLSS